jgi:hypothetical protein
MARNPFQIVSDEVNRTINNISKGKLIDGAIGLGIITIFFLGTLALINLVL